MTSLLREDLPGTDEEDVLVGSDAVSVILGYGGEDVLVGAQSQDYLNGGDGNDIIIGGGLRSGFWNVDTDLNEDIVLELAYFEEPHPRFVAENLIGGAGDDLIIGGSWDDENDDGAYQNAGEPVWSEFILDGGNSEESTELNPFTGETLSVEERLALGFNNIVWAGTGADTVFGANGYDTLGGGAGDDVLYGLDGADVIFGGAGDDMIFGGDGEALTLHRVSGVPLVIQQRLYGGAGNDDIWGGEDADKIVGGTGDDRLNSGAGSDTLIGGAGNDWISGGGDDDLITTGVGVDSIYFYFGEGADTVTDFDITEDRIILDMHERDDEFMTALSNAVEATQNGVSGLFIDTGEGSLFLQGLTAADVNSIEVIVFGPD